MEEWTYHNEVRHTVGWRQEKETAGCHQHITVHSAKVGDANSGRNMNDEEKWFQDETLWNAGGTCDRRGAMTSNTNWGCTTGNVRPEPGKSGIGNIKRGCCGPWHQMLHWDQGKWQWLIYPNLRSGEYCSEYEEWMFQWSDGAHTASDKSSCMSYTTSNLTFDSKECSSSFTVVWAQQRHKMIQI